MDRLLTIKEVSQVLRTNPSTVYKIIKAGHIPALKLGSLKVREVSLDVFLEKFDGMDFTDLDDVRPLQKNDFIEGRD